MSFCSDSMCNMYRYLFSIAAECGNNAFSYDARKQKEIFVSSLIHAPLTEMKQGEHIAFSELDEDGVEANCLGLANFIRQGKFFLFDNHNHCYYFYKHFLRENKIEAMDLVHVDQHKDMRRPAKNGGGARRGDRFGAGMLSTGDHAGTIFDTEKRLRVDRRI